MVGVHTGAATTTNAATAPEEVELGEADFDLSSLASPTPTRPGVTAYDDLDLDADSGGLDELPDDLDDLEDLPDEL